MVDVASARFLLTAVASWLTRQQQEAMAYLIEENRILRGQLRGRRLRLTDDERRRLAVRGQRLGRRELSEVATIVTVLRQNSYGATLGRFDGNVKRRPDVDTDG